MKAFITGGAGFIGSNIVKKFLENGHQVVIYDNLSTGYHENIPQHPRVKFIRGDILDKELLQKSAEGTDVILHLAAAVGNVRSLENPVQDSQVNVLGTLHVLDVARKWKVPKIVYSSSAAIFGEPRQIPLDEDHPLAPDSPYGVSKLAGELQALCYTKLYNMDIVCLRYFNVYGPNQRFDAYGNVIPIFVTKKINGQPLTIYGDGEQTRDFVHVFDVAQANYLAATTEKVRGTFNIGSGVAMTINELARRINETGTEKPVPIQYLPSRKGEVIHSRACIEKAQIKLGFIPTQNIQQGLEGYYQWIKMQPAS